MPNSNLSGSKKKNVRMDIGGQPSLSNEVSMAVWLSVLSSLHNTTFMDLFVVYQPILPVHFIPSFADRFPCSPMPISST